MPFGCLFNVTFRDLPQVAGGNIARSDLVPNGSRLKQGGEMEIAASEYQPKRFPLLSQSLSSRAFTKPDPDLSVARPFITPQDLIISVLGVGVCTLSANLKTWSNPPSPR